MRLGATLRSDPRWPRRDKYEEGKGGKEGKGVDGREGSGRKLIGNKGEKINHLLRNHAYANAVYVKLFSYNLLLET